MQIKSILYVTTQIPGTQRYFSWSAYPSIWYARVQKDVLDTITSCKYIESYIKFYPNDVCSNPNKIFTALKKNNIVMLEKSLVSILEEKKFDLIITEACATTLLEVLCTKSQIIAFFPKEYVKIENDNLKMLEKRVYLANSKVHYIELLKSLIKGMLEGKSLNDEFLFKFGLGNLIDSPVELAKKHLFSVINR